jgi:5-methylcytosine-specific restriction endonuclease McrA
VCREHFQTAQHYAAWRAGAPLRTQRPRRWKVPLKWRESVMRHANYRCQWPGCGTTEGVTIEHVIPVVLGGSNNPANLSVLCRTHQTASFDRFREILKAIDEVTV